MVGRIIVDVDGTSLLLLAALYLEVVEGSGADSVLLSLGAAPKVFLLPSRVVLSAVQEIIRKCCGKIGHMADVPGDLPDEDSARSRCH